MKARRNKAVPAGGLSLAERGNLERAIESDKQLLERATGNPASEGESHMPVTEVMEFNEGAVHARIKRNEEALRRLSPQPASGAERQRLEGRAKELAEFLAPKMLTKAELDYFPAKPGDMDAGIKDANYRKAVDKACSSDGEHSAAFVQAATEWKGIMRRLYPDDPDMPTLERIRPAGDSSSGRHFG